MSKKQHHNAPNNMELKHMFFYTGMFKIILAKRNNILQLLMKFGIHFSR